MPLRHSYPCTLPGRTAWKLALARAMSTSLSNGARGQGAVFLRFVQAFEATPRELGPPLGGVSGPMSSCPFSEMLTVQLQRSTLCCDPLVVANSRGHESQPGSSLVLWNPVWSLHGAALVMDRHHSRGQSERINVGMCIGDGHGMRHNRV